MKTYQDLEAVGENLLLKGAFCKTAIDEFMMSKEYAEAKAGEEYYNKHNTTIEQFQKYLYTLSGRRVKDIFSANYKLKTLFFRRLVTQQVQYVLGNGVNFNEPENKPKLGKDFDFQLQMMAKRAMSAGRAFGFWNFDHLEVFGYADTPAEAGFCPLYNEMTSQLDAGIRYWFRKIGDETITRFTLYEVDGYTEFIKKKDEAVQILQEKRAYKRTITESPAGGIENVLDENYSRLPIIPLYANDSKESELNGIRECIDCYDYIKSGLANDIDDTAGFYWVLKNTGGMDDADLSRFVQRMRTTKATALDGDDGVEAEAHTLDVPTEARRLMLELLRKDIYEDFQALDVNTLSASAKTTQEIQASYQSQDNKCADFEYYLIDFVQQILELAGIDDEPTFRWNRVVNQLEQTQMIMQSANYLTEDVIIKHLPFLTPEEADEILQQREMDDFDQFNGDEEEESDNSDLEDLNAMLDEIMEALGDE